MLRSFLFFQILFIVLSAGAFASTTGSVGSAAVKAGETKVEARFGYSEAEESSSQDERFRTRFQIDHGFNEWYAGRIVVRQDKRKGDSYEHESVTFTNRVQLLDKAEEGFDFGFRLSYALQDGDKKADFVEFGLYEVIPYEDYEFRMNQIFAHDVGQESEDGVSGELRLQGTRAISESHRLGLESYHDFGNLTTLSGYSAQSHQIGPVLKGKFGDGYAYETGYRAGISEGAPDHNMKFFISKTF